MLNFSNDQSATETISLAVLARRDSTPEKCKTLADYTRPTTGLARGTKRWIREDLISPTLDSSTQVSQTEEMTASTTKPISRPMMSDLEMDLHKMALANLSREAEIALAIEEMRAVAEGARAVEMLAEAGVVGMLAESAVAEM